MTRSTLRTISALVSAGLVRPEAAPALELVARQYAIAIPASLTGLINSSDPYDPIARQYVPDARELVTLPSEVTDPIGDNRHSPVKGIVHRYPDRVLLKVVSVCPVYCRFCFRREMVGPGKSGNLSPHELDAALAYIASNSGIREVIVTGGDPFILAAQRMASLTSRLSAISHVQKIRWHTRVPVVEPTLVNDALVNALKSAAAEVVVAVHANHPAEFSIEAEAAISRLDAAGISMLSQSVLLKGVNDNIETLSSLMQAFTRNHIKPYYLHHADLAPGTSHFRTTISLGRDLMRELRRNTPTPDLPSYVLDLPGGYSKVNLETDAAVRKSDRNWQLRDDQGQWHDYVEDAALFGQHL